MKSPGTSPQGWGSRLLLTGSSQMVRCLVAIQADGVRFSGPGPAPRARVAESRPFKPTGQGSSPWGCTSPGSSTVERTVHTREVRGSSPCQGTSGSGVGLNTPLSQRGNRGLESLLPHHGGRSVTVSTVGCDPASWSSSLHDHPSRTSSTVGHSSDKREEPGSIPGCGTSCGSSAR